MTNGTGGGKHGHSHPAKGSDKQSEAKKTQSQAGTTRGKSATAGTKLRG